MSGRRRRGNKLLGRILLISVVVHVIAIPILAQFGAFEKIRRQFMTSTVTVIPPPPPEVEKPVEKKAEQKKQVAKAKGASRTSKAQARSNAPHPPVVASTVTTNGQGGTGPTIDPNGTGKAGVVPSVGGKTGTGTTPPPTNPPTQPETKVNTKPETKTDTKPEPRTEPVKPHVPVLATAEAIFQPQPEVPDDLRAEALDKTCIVEISVGADGLAASVKVGNSSGVDELDQIAVSAAKKWRFKPATRDGEAIPSLVRLHIQFKVD